MESGHPRALLVPQSSSHPFSNRRLEFKLGDSIIVGRAVAKCKPQCDNAIFDCKVLSRNHAVLWYQNGKFYLKDTRSSNGTFVNCQRLSVANTESHAQEILSNDTIQFGVEVVENVRNVCHSCIVLTIKLYHADGSEAARVARDIISDLMLSNHNNFISNGNGTGNNSHQNLLYNNSNHMNNGNFNNGSNSNTLTNNHSNFSPGGQLIYGCPPSPLSSSSSSSSSTSLSSSSSTSGLAGANNTITTNAKTISTSINSSGTTLYADLATLLREAEIREQMLREKLAVIEDVLCNAHAAVDEIWGVCIGEDLLLSDYLRDNELKDKRIDNLRFQLQVLESMQGQHEHRAKQLENELNEKSEQFDRLLRQIDVICHDREALTGQSNTYKDNLLSIVVGVCVLLCAYAFVC